MSATYDPNSQASNTEKVIAGHWELPRRNEEFRKLSRRWVQSEVFRQSHALSTHYHDMQNHTPRCARDWMLSDEDFKEQLETLNEELETLNAHPLEQDARRFRGEVRRIDRELQRGQSEH